MQESLLSQLQTAEKALFGETDFRISSNINNHLIPVAEALLNRIPSYMPEYTLHNIGHCRTILDNIRKILPDQVQLNIIELTILIQAVFLHDIGMVINKEEAETIKKTSEFKKTFIDFEANADEDDILTEYIRRNHVTKSLEYIDLFKNDFNTYKIDFTFNGIDLSDWVKNVILSHAHGIDFLKNEEKYPKDKLIDTYRVNIQYIATLLRLGDILDFDLFRTPYFLYKHINPQNKISIEEWRKHQSIEGKCISGKTIEFDAKCSSARIERSVRDFVEWIETERRDTIGLLGNNSSYALDLTNEVILKCRNDGSYIFTDLQINLDYEKVLSILMGTELYDSANIFIRELIQNAYDACKMRTELSERYDDTFVPKISITYSTESLILKISDNGIGIDESVFQNYLIKIGKSYYKSKSFQSADFRFSPISNFGIGIISCFMVSDSIEIESTKYYGPLDTPTPIHYILNLHDRFTEKRKSVKSNFGTTITLQLKEDYASKLENDSLLNIIQQSMNYQEIPINLTIDDNVHCLNKKSISIPEEYTHINNIAIFEIEEQDWIEGNIIVYQSQHQTIISGGKVSQQCFAISQSSSQLGLAPVWMQHCEFNINISPPRKLQLKANRNKIIENDDFIFLKNFILEFLIEKFDSSEYENMLPLFLTSKPFRFSGNDKEYDFLTRRIKFYAFSSNKGKQVILSQITKKYQGKRIALLHRDYFNTPGCIDKCSFLFKKYDLILVQDGYIDFLFGFLRPYIKEDNLIATGISGLIYREFLLKSNIALDVNDYINKKTIYNQIKYRGINDKEITYKGNKEQLFCIVGNNQYNNIDLQFNANHKLTKLLLSGADSLYVRRFTASFENNLAMALHNETTLVSYQNYNGQHHFSNNNHQSLALKCIGLIKTSFITTLNKSLLEDVLQPLKKLEILDGDPSTYLLTEVDFPEWWISKD
ncbi:HD domain-containing protein [Hymenobacter elongatus]|uniref:HD-CE domain-containing protein n=1 Tax=Hymenobacter elongatus TaxID=877208 RepID=A0A4Z0PKG0_9BACT|nr:ATP-binding protein [Hymenobacter elongatus]TGE15584.1 hypothetical protein E5J99_12355 [Hymenobacter elongatus]